MTSQSSISIVISSRSLHSLFLNGLLTPVQFIQFVGKALKLRQVEFFEGDLCDDILAVDDHVIEEWACACQQNSVDIYAISAKNDLTVPESVGSTVSDDIARLKRWISIAPRLGIKVLRINTGLQQPTHESYQQLKTRLLSLRQEAAEKSVLLAVENHPHPFYTQNDVDNYAEFAHQAFSLGLKLCLDTGSFGKNFNRDSIIRAIDQLVPFSGHLHFNVPAEHGTLEQIKQFYTPFVNILHETHYEGAITVEYVERPLSTDDPVAATCRSIRALAELLGITPHAVILTQNDLPILRSTTTGAPEIPANIRLDEEILPLVVEGCRSRIQARTMLQTFVANSRKNYPSHDWGHACTPHIPLRGSPNNLCGIISQDANAEMECERFYTATFNEIRETGTLRRPICQCPLGLTLMFTPVAKDTRLYGAMACGGWREAGAERALFYGINEHVSSATIREKALEEISRLEVLGPDQLQSARDTMRKVTEYLDRFYQMADDDEHRRQEEDLITKLSESIRTRFRTLAKIQDDVVDVLQIINTQIDAGLIALYLSEPFEELESELDFERVGSVPPNQFCSNQFRLSGALAISLKAAVKAGASVEDENASEVARNVSPKKPNIVRAHQLTDKRMALFCISLNRPESQLPMVDRAWHHIAHALQNTARLDDAENQASRLQLLADTARHALNNPLQGVQFATGRLLSLAESRCPIERLREQAFKVCSHVDEAAAVIDGLSGATLLKADVVRHQLNLELTDLHPIIIRSVQVVKLAGSRRNIEFRIELGSLPAIECDKRQLRLLFMNLLENAVKYSHSHRHIRIYAHQLRDEEHNFVEVTVEDFGLGIPERFLTKIFDPYFQVPIGDAKRSIAGTGLGLFLCKSVVEQHGGTIKAETEIPTWKRSLPEKDQLQGCQVRFTVRLPTRQLAKTE